MRDRERERERGELAELSSDPHANEHDPKTAVRSLYFASYTFHVHAGTRTDSYARPAAAWFQARDIIGKMASNCGDVSGASSVLCGPISGKVQAFC